MAGGALGFWNDWASQIGVLLSLFFQFLLHMFANIRRCKDGSYWLRFPLWVAYQLSDSTATYAAGQLLFSGATKDHHLIAFWVPFLLLHLGGPDNITAYALEDSKLWGRHLLSLLVQVLGAGYVLYRHIIGSGTLLMVAAILISVVGVAKYGERTWALRSAKFSNLLGSSWAFAFLCATQWDWLRHSALCAGRWHRLRHTLFFLRWSWPGKMTIMTGSSRRWSGTMGQRNMVRSCTRQVDPMNRSLGKLCKMLSLGEWWDRRYLWTIDVSEKVKKPAEKWILSRRSVGDMNTMGLRRTKWGELALNKEDYPGLLKDLEDYHGVDFHESVISWHIATDLILAEIDRRGDHVSDDQVELVSVLSNYMMFLLVDSPDMLPGLPQKWLYEQTCKQLKKICTKHIAGSAGNSFWTMLKNLFRPHHHRGWKPSELEKEIAIDILSEFERSNVSNPRLTYARAIAVKLLHRKEDVVYALLLLWVDFLAHAANRCNREAHARKLGSGGELLTVIWLYQEHLHQVKEEIRKGQNPV